jgi:hypothetical protein
MFNMADKEDTERRVYVLPEPLLKRVRAYQTANALTSEVEAVRRLLDHALQMRDNVRDILNAVKARMQVEKDLRVIAGDIVTPHALVISVNIGDHQVEFMLKDGTGGRFNSWGHFEVYEEDFFGDGRTKWTTWPEPKKPTVSKSEQKKLTSPEPDDDIPF